MQNLILKTLRERKLGIPRCRWEDNTKMKHKEIVFIVLSWLNMVSPGDPL
jgi:hypothetical protein